MAVFGIADLHLSLGGNKPMDKFPGWEGYVDKIYNNWNSLVTPDDTVIVSGDISWGMSMEEALPDFKFIEELPGKKYFIKGNHDYWWSTVAKMKTFFSENGLLSMEIIHNSGHRVEDIIIAGSRGWINEKSQAQNVKIIKREALRLELSIQSALKIDANTVPTVFLHYPPIMQNSMCDEMMEVLEKYNINTCYYGHLHGDANKYALTGTKGNINFFNISCDAVDFCPVKVNNI